MKANTRSLGILTLTLFALLNAGCDNALVKFVHIDRPIADILPIPFEGASSTKISPGHTSATSADISMKVHVTITDRFVTGDQVSAKVSMSRTTKLE